MHPEKPLTREQKQKIRAELQRDAAESRPLFSEALHRRIVTAVEQRHAAASTRKVRRSVVRWTLAVAAAACLLFTIVSDHSTSKLSDTPASQTTAATGPSTGAVDPAAMQAAMATWSSWADNAANDLDWQLVSQTVAVPSDQLKRDTRVAVETVLSRLPINVEWLAE